VPNHSIVGIHQPGIMVTARRQDLDVVVDGKNVNEIWATDSNL
jgi:PP-loop superfamily ATP-utilizing enzyme